MKTLKERIPPSILRRLRRLARPANLGTAGLTTPISRHWGFDRGTPIDRYYIERFLQQHANDVHGHVLEVKDASYTRRFGTDVTKSDVLDIDPANPHATVVADLATPGLSNDATFDCFILTQTLHIIYDTRAAIRRAYHLLRPGGVLLVTVPALSRATVPDYWRFTPASCRLLFGEVFGPGEVAVAAHGNVLTSVAFLHGMAYQELARRDLDADDEMFPLVVTVRAVKGGGGGAAAPA
jgi:SAM-dependent methyltransferase